MTTTRALRRLAPGATVPAPRQPTSAIPLGPPSEAAVPIREGSPQSVVGHVADFYGAYTDALYDLGRGELAHALRHHYLTAELCRSLIRWEAAHQGDGVLRAKGVPARWSVTYNDSGMGHCWSRVTLSWEGPGHEAPAHHTHLLVRSDLATRRISGIWTDK
ncbi:hypothetical protein ACOT81_05970 [Streptomyces sp. WI04-05B]|uniref:hypothetical protein n=1 Tax=Streptomyces TaxID=1883 RepID=UPI0029A05DA3|nr:MULTISPECIES: hypothetical protein [unclassified Streptomyces]MDX2545119.1 hypothetical protein [Streptomyces sp. WI04-05B]MDX2587610.1 hypothetical protein [Streptomyces sp. WI04-05A]